MTEKISHEAARLAVFETRPANTELLQSYITQQQSLEADTVSRAEHEARQRQLAEALGMMHEPCQGPTWPADWDALLTTATEAKARLTELQAELEQVNKVTNHDGAAKAIEWKTPEGLVRLYVGFADKGPEALANAQDLRLAGYVPDSDLTALQAEHGRVVTAFSEKNTELFHSCQGLLTELATERARAEEAERRLAAANARVGRLEEALRELTISVVTSRKWPKHELEQAWAALSTAPQASTEQPDVGARAAEARQRIELEALDQATEQVEPFANMRCPDCSTVFPRASMPRCPTCGLHFGQQAPQSPAVGEEPMTPAEMFGGCFHDMKSQPAPSPAVGNPHSGSSFESAFTAKELAEIRAAQPAPGGTERPCPKCSSSDKFCSVLGCIEEEPEPTGAHMTAADFAAVSSTDDDDPTPAEPPPVDYVTRAELVEALKKAGADTETDAVAYAGRILERAGKARGR